jgi:glycine betaine/proline transport system ATP-binding protein
MRDPKYKLNTEQKPQEASRAMETNKIDRAFVVDSQDKLIGVIKSEDISQAVTRNICRLCEIKIETAVRIGADQPIRDLLPLAASSDCAVAVVDENEKLIGEVSREALLLGMIGKE